MVVLCQGLLWTPLTFGPPAALTQGFCIGLNGSVPSLGCNIVNTFGFCNMYVFTERVISPAPKPQPGGSGDYCSLGVNLSVHVQYKNHI